MFYMSNLNSTGEATTLIVGTDGCESDYDFVDLGATIGKKINSNCDLKLTIISENLNTYLIELGIMLSTYRFENFKSKKSPKINKIEDTFVLIYLNRLSDLLWMMARDFEKEWTSSK